jgi:hypothetical protein
MLTGPDLLCEVSTSTFFGQYMILGLPFYIATPHSDVKKFNIRCYLNYASFVVILS